MSLWLRVKKNQNTPPPKKTPNLNPFIFLNVPYFRALWKCPNQASEIFVYILKSYFIPFSCFIHCSWRFTLAIFCLHICLGNICSLFPSDWDYLCIYAWRRQLVICYCHLFLFNFISSSQREQGPNTARTDRLLFITGEMLDFDIMHIFSK